MIIERTILLINKRELNYIVSSQNISNKLFRRINWDFKIFSKTKKIFQLNTNKFKIFNTFIETYNKTKLYKKKPIENKLISYFQLCLGKILLDDWIKNESLLIRMKSVINIYIFEIILTKIIKSWWHWL